MQLEEYLKQPGTVVVYGLPTTDALNKASHRIIKKPVPVKTVTVKSTTQLDSRQQNAKTGKGGHHTDTGIGRRWRFKV